MTPERQAARAANKALARRAIAYNHGATDDAGAIFAPVFVAHMPGHPPMDRASFERSVAGVTAGIPGHVVEVEDQIADGDLVVNRFTARGVHSRELAGVPATGRSVEIRGINVFRIEAGRVVEQWTELDLLGLLQQIGKLPT